jgi:thiamine-phosphate pyrophosphorylase
LISRLYAILDRDAAAQAGWTLTDLARAYVDGGARLLQIRAKSLSGAAFLDAASAIVRLGRAAGATVIVNDRADIARLAGADGVHLGQHDLAPRAARSLLGDAALVGLSTHTPDQLDRAANEPVSYLAIGPVFATSTKATGYAPVGVEMVTRAARGGRPVVAIGGVTLKNARSALAGGASAVAVISDLLSTGDPARRVREYLAALAPEKAPRGPER